MRLKSSLILSSIVFYLTSFFATPALASQEPNKNASINKLLHSYLNLASLRHKTLSENVANLNTPGYTANEVRMPHNMEQLMGKQNGRRPVSLRLTSSKHMVGRKVITGSGAVEKLQDPFEIKPNGNNVSLAQQMAKISQNELEYQKALTAYQGLNSLTPAILGNK